MKDEQLLKIKNTRSCLNAAVSHINKAKNLMAKSIKINDESFLNSDFISIENNINNYIYRINNSIIPSINNG